MKKIQVLFISFFKFFKFIFIVRERGREGKREGEKYPGMCPDCESTQQYFS